MEIKLNEKQMAVLAQQTAQIVVNLLQQSSQATAETEYVGVAEAARILGISVYHLRHIKDDFPHVKRGNNQQGRLLFLKSALLTAYTKS